MHQLGRTVCENEDDVEPRSGVFASALAILDFNLVLLVAAYYVYLETPRPCAGKSPAIPDLAPLYKGPCAGAASIIISDINNDYYGRADYESELCQINAKVYILVAAYSGLEKSVCTNQSP